jgi:alkaline phosphatase
MKFSRRMLLGGGATGLLAGSMDLAASGQSKKSRGRQPQNIIFCVADGMAMATLTMANYYQQITAGHPSYWTTLLDAPYALNGLQNTRSLNSLVTDSAAASSAWGSGRHIWNGQLNAYPDKTELRTLASLMQEAGVRTGLVTTTTITHATPSGFAISCIDRDLEGLIAEKHLTAGVDVLMGGGNKFFSPTLRPDKRDLYADFTRAGYTVVKTRQELLGLDKPKKILGVFHDSHMPFTVDHLHSPELLATRPTLAEMTRAALTHLHPAPKGFLLQIEGGKVDHGGHSNDLAALLYDQMAFEEAVKVAVEFALKDKETLVIITADHATGGPALNGAGPEYIDSTEGLKTLSGMKASYEPIFKAFGASPTRTLVRDVIHDSLSIALTKEEADAVVSAVNGASPFAVSSFYKGPQATLAIVLGNYSKVTWTSQNHTSDHVLVTAIGPGKEFVAGLNANVSFFDRMLATKGLKWSNPTMTFEEAIPHYQKLKAALNPELYQRYAVRDETSDLHGGGLRAG